MLALPRAGNPKGCCSWEPHAPPTSLISSLAMQTLLRSRPWLAAAVVALVACSVAELAGWGGPPLIRRRLQAAVRHQVVWRQESPHFVHARFAKDTHPGDPVVYFRTWFFNITNLAAVQQGAKPALVSAFPARPPADLAAAF